ncbi:MAG: anaerobic ribonucleoside-triphosphate reductase activating protein [Lachnospiraceae bacterium]|nr:anaerobic ribonucleoside-triphosphate reductase activating protein [Lachnospiraceae bacterium]
MNYHNITYPDMNNGSGLRVVLWLSGCSHKCQGCQNPQTWDANSGIPFDESAKEELFRELDKDYISGLTLTGGDPLHEANLDGVLDLVNKIRLSCPQKSIWLYTGYIWEQLFEDDDFDIQGGICENQTRRAIILSCDVLIDGKYIDSLQDITLPYRGSKNQRVINIKESIKKNEIILYSN